MQPAKAKPRNTKTAFEPADFKLAYLAAFEALRLNVGLETAEELSRLTTSPADLVDTVKALRDAPEYGRVFAALELLRDRRRSESTRVG